MKTLGCLLAGLMLVLAMASEAGARSAAEAAYQRGDYAEAAALWTEAARGGDRVAQWMLGRLYELGGRGLPKDVGEANHWYRKAIQGDDAGATWSRGLAAAWGKAGASRSLRAAESLYRRAAKEGGAEFQARLGRCYQGDLLPPCGLRKNYAKAKRYFAQSAKASHPAGYCGLADLHASGLGVVRNARAAQDYRAQAELGGAACGAIEQVASASPEPPVETKRAATSEPPPEPTGAQIRYRALVAQVQRELARLGFEPGPADGESGDRTRRAIFDFQTRLGLDADGQPSADLLGELLRAEPASLGKAFAATTKAPVSPAPQRSSLPAPEGAVDFGRYKALVIGNQDYQELPGLGTATRDAEAVAALLEERYGFDVELVRNGTRAALISKFATLRKELQPDDNLLVYYAGHGWYDEESERGYWLPVDAAEQDRSNWISNGTLTDDLKAIRAKHVMVVADSCYSGTWTRALNLRNRGDDYLTEMARKRARVVLASGNLEPVTDRGGRGHSVFARAFLDALAQNDGVIDGTQLFAQIRRPVMLDSDQTPQYGDIRNAGHGGGDFLFIRRD